MGSGGTTNRVIFVAVAISATTGQTYLLRQILQWTTAKTDDGDAGEWHLTLPLFNPLQNGQPPSQVVLDYAAVAGPMDLIAIFAVRLTTSSVTFTGVSGSNAQSPQTALGPVGSTTGNINITGLSYGDIASIVNLGSPSCVMIGMVDSVEEVTVEMSQSPEPILQLDGRDLTKIFYVNFTFVPEASSASAQNAILGSPLTLAVKREYSGTTLLLDVLKLSVAKDLGSTKLPAATQAAAAVFGYPWQNFVRTDDQVKLDPNFKSLAEARYPPFQFQDGSVWANVQELRNAPTCRLFVDELGNLLFDDAISAWTTAAPLPNFINESDIVSFRVRISDDDLVTYLQVMPTASYNGSMPLALATGSGAALGFGQGIAAGAKPGATSISTYGYRHGLFSSYWDVNSTEAQAKIKVLSLQHNALEKATLVLRGTTAVHVGDRLLVPVSTARAVTSNAIWYIEAINHSASMGGSWLTTLSMRFPNGGF